MFRKSSRLSSLIVLLLLLALIQSISNPAQAGQDATASLLNHTDLDPVSMLNVALPPAESITANASSAPEAEGGGVSGTVFRDYDADGLKDAREPGVSGITVTAYDASGASVATATTGSDGTYGLTVNNATDVRVEFTDIPAYLQAGASGSDSETTVTFATSPATGVDVGLNNPANYCQQDPTLATNCYLFGDQAGQTGDVLVSFDFDAGCVDDNLDGNCDTQGETHAGPAPNHVARGQEIGTTWGLAYEGATDSLFAASFMKRHSGFLNHGDTGVIYRVQGASTNSPTITPYVDLDSLGIDTGTDPHPTSGTSCGTVATSPDDDCWTYDPDSWDWVGKMSFGDLDISDDGKSLWTINLLDRKLYEIPVKNGNVNANQINSYDIPSPANCVDAATNLRPFATGFNDGLVYVGMVCTAETTQNAADMRMYVYSMDPADGSFSEVLDEPLNYPRGAVVVDNGSSPLTIPAEWNPWVTTFTIDSAGKAWSYEYGYPQPWLTDIEFDNGDLILGLRDRYADQMGFKAGSTDISSSTLYSGDVAGDILRACPNNSGGWDLESDGSCGGVTTNGSNNNAEGPGTGEFYFEDDYPIHDEISIGGLVQVPGSPVVVETVFDPIYDFNEFFDGGIIWLNNDTGARTNAYRLFSTNDDDPATFGKAGGLGDMEALCAPAPIELGNRVWQDSNGNGIQDPGEPVLAGVTVTLHDMANNGNQIGTVTTDANGNYLFGGVNNVNISGSLLTNSDYEIRIDLTDANLNGLVPTQANQGNDNHDSDASRNGGFAVIEVSTGAAGANNHTYDFGFEAEATYSLGDTVWYDTNQDGIQDNGEPGVEGVVATLYSDATCTISTGQTATTDANGLYQFTGLATGTYCVEFTSIPTGWSISPPDQGNDDAVDSDANNNAQITNISLGPDDMTNDMGIYQSGTVGNQVWCEASNPANTSFNSGTDNPLAGIGVMIHADSNCDQTADGDAIASMNTDQNGQFSFTGLELLPPGNNTCYVVSVDPTDEDLGTCDNPITPTTDSVTLTPDNPTDEDSDFGFEEQPKYTLGDTVWYDSNQDGIQDNGDNGETGVQNIKVELFSDATCSTSTGMTTVTTAAGFYEFKDLSAGDYCVQFSNIPAGWSVSPANQGGDDAADSDATVTADATVAQITNITLSANDPTNDMGIYTTGSIGDQLWCEGSDPANNSYDGGPSDLPMADVLITLYADSNCDDAADSATALQTLNTDASGQYSFTGLTVTPPSAPTCYVVEVDVTDTELGTCSNPITPATYNVDLDTDSPDNDTSDFGFVNIPSLTIGDTVWQDQDGDGLQDAGEPGVSGVVVTLYDGEGNVVNTTTTDADGNYLFTSNSNGDILTAGDYQVGFTLPAGYTFTTPNQGDNDENDSDADTTTGKTPIFTMAAGDVNLTLDAGLIQPAAIGNYVWLDENQDGKQDAGEQGIPNVKVILLDAQGTQVAETTTDANGGYLFPNLVPGSYFVDVDESSVPGMTQTPLATGNDIGADLNNQDHSGNGYPVTVGSGEENLTADFGYNWNPGSIGDSIWVDTDGDGVQDPDEIGIENVCVELYGDPDGNGVYDTLIQTTTTNASGNYIFENVTPGGYVVKVCDSNFDPGGPLVDYTPTGDPDQPGIPATNPDNMTTTPVVVGPGDVIDTIDFGYQPPAPLGSIGDTVWFDADASGTATQDAGENGIEGVTVALIQDTNGNGVQDAGEPIIATDTTDGNGNYLFTDLPLDASYIVWVNDTDSVLANMSQTYDKDGLATLNMSATTLTTSNPNDLAQDFSYTPQGHGPTDGIIGDTIFLDIDADGTQGDNEPGLEGIIVILTDSDGNQTTTTTDENGNYTFGDLDPNGTYTVTVAPENFEPGGVLEGMSNTADPDGGKDSASSVDLSQSPNGINLDQDFGFAPPTNQTGKIGNLIWFDTNADGVYDSATESPIAGVTVDLYQDLNNNGNVDAGEPLIGSATTSGSIDATAYGSDGNYIFNGLPEGSYVVDVTDVDGVLAGYSHSLGTAGSNNNSQSDPYGVTIEAGGENLTADFGYYVNGAAVGNFVWADLNSDGIQNDGEPGLAGVTVTLDITYPDGTTVQVVEQTNAEGYYSFDNLLLNPLYDGQGIYATPGVGGGDEPYFNISVTTPTDYTPTQIEQGGNTLLDSNNHSGTQAIAQQGNSNVPTTATDPATEQSVASYDFGFVPPVQLGSIGDYVWVDADGDGVQDPGESGIPNVTVKLIDENGNVITTTTDSNGNYIFNDLPAGSYTIQIDPTTLPADQNLTPSYDLDGILNNNSSITLNPGQNIETVDFGYKPVLPELGAIGNYVWLDEDSDGYQDAGEPGIANVIVELQDADGNVIKTTVTDSTGHYLFPDLEAGSYQVVIPSANQGTGGALEGLTQSTEQPIPAGSDLGNQSSPYSITLGEGEENLTADFGYNWNPSDEVNNNTGTATIGDTVWIDADGDGKQDPNEVGVEGVTVNLYNDPDGDGVYDNLVGTTTTNPNGHYIFDDLTPGAYVVEVVPTGTPIDGYTQTGDPDQFGSPATNPDNKTTTPVVVGPGDVYLNADFGYQAPDNSPTGTIGDTVWFDADASGTSSPDAGEYGIPGVTVALIKDTNGNGVWDSGEPIIASDVTDSNGNYLFEGLPLDTSYIVWVNDTDNVLDGLKPTFDADGLSSPDMSATTLTAGSPSNLDQDFSYAPVNQGPNQGLIGDTIYLDIDGDGTQDPNEPALEGVIVVLTDQFGNETTTSTDENGHYYFEGLNPANTYTVTVAPENFQPGGVLEGLDNSGDPDGGNDNTSSVDLSTSGPINLDQDFGYTPQGGQVGSIGNLVWFDNNADGQYDSAIETPIGGVTVDIYRDLNGNGQIDPGEPRFGSTVTMGTINSADYGSNGNYLFSGLPAGSYMVDVTDVNGVLAGYSHSLGTAGTNNHSQMDPYAVTIAAGGQDLTADFGYYTPQAGIGNFVWVDSNDDGIQDAGEAGLANVTVTLDVTYPDGTTVTVVTTTNEEGYYTFGNLLTDEDYDGTGTPATPNTGGGDEPYFNISVITPAGGYTPTLVDQGDSDLVDSDDHSGTQAEPKQGQTAIPTTVTDGSTEQPIASYDFGFQPPANLGSIGDFIWLDSDGDGVQDPEEVGIAGVTVQLLDSDGNVVATTTTGPDGKYLFDEVPAGSYTVKVDPTTLPEGVTQTFDLDGTLNNETPVTLGEGENKTDVDFGYEPPAQVGSIGDYVWMDTNGDGVQDPDEQPIPNVTVILTDENGNQTTVTTDANGKYLFPDLPAGQYTVTIDPNSLPTDVRQTFDLDGTLDHSTQVTLVAGQDKLDVDFGYQVSICTGTIGDTVFNDLNGNGTQEDGETGIAGAVINLLGAGEDGLLGTADDIQYSSQTTDDNGNYQFINLPAGLYQIKVDETTIADGLALTTGNEPELTIQTNCQTFSDADFGYAPSVCQRSVMYGVHDSGSFNSQFFKLDLGTGVSAPLGPLYNSYDVESIELHPTTNKLYAIGGGDGDQDGKLFEIDKETGALTELGNTGTGAADEIVSAAFASDGTLWAYQQNVGLVTVDVNDGSTNVVWNHNTTGIANWEGLAWSPDGNYLYGSEGTVMYRYDPTDQSVTQVCDDNFLPNSTEALDFRFDGKLLGGWHNATDNALSIFEIDIDTCSVIPTSFDTPYNDVESLTSEQCVVEGVVEGQVTNSPADSRAPQAQAGVEVKLEVDINGDGTFSFSTTTTTDDNGNYRFVNMPTGEYRITVVDTGETASFNIEGRDLVQEVNLDGTGTINPPTTGFNLFLPLVIR